MHTVLCAVAVAGLSEDMAIKVVLHESCKAFRMAAIPKKYQHEYSDQVEYVRSMWPKAVKFVEANPPVTDGGEADFRLGEIRSKVPYIRFTGKRDAEVLATLLRLGEDRHTISPVIGLGELSVSSGATKSTTKGAVRRLEAMGLINRTPGSGAEATAYFLLIPEGMFLKGEFPVRAEPGVLCRSTPGGEQGDVLTTKDAFQQEFRMGKGRALTGSSLQIYRCLQKAECPLRASKIAEIEMLSQSTVRDHLRRMQKLDLIKSIEGNRQEMPGAPSAYWVLADAGSVQRSARLEQAAVSLRVDGIQKAREQAVEDERLRRAERQEAWRQANNLAWEWRQSLEVDLKDEDKNGHEKRIYPEWQWLTLGWFWPEVIPHLAEEMGKGPTPKRDDWLDSIRTIFDEVEEVREDLEVLLGEDVVRNRWGEGNKVRLGRDATRRIVREQDHRDVVELLLKKASKGRPGYRSGRLKRSTN